MQGKTKIERSVISSTSFFSPPSYFSVGSGELCFVGHSSPLMPIRIIIEEALHLGIVLFLRVAFIFRFKHVSHSQHGKFCMLPKLLESCLSTRNY